MTDTLPVSLVLTVLNEAESLPAFFASLVAQGALPAEVVIADGGSKDGTVEAISAWDPPAGVEVHCLVVPGASISEGRNAAIHASTYDFVIVTDGGTTLQPGWVLGLYEALRDGADVASGFFRPAGHTVKQRIIAAIITPTIDEINPEKFLPSSRSVGFRKEALADVGGYPEWLDYCEDLVLDLSLKAEAARFAFVPEAIVTWNARPTLNAFMVQYYRYARGDAKARLWGRRHLARYTSYALGVAGLAWSVRHPMTLVALAVGAAMYLAKPIGRVIGHQRDLAYPLASGIAVVPLVVALGDLAKMAGYAAGQVGRLRTDASRER